MDDTQFKELKDKLGVITKLLTLNLVRDMKLQKDKIIVLASFGFQPVQIAELLGTTPDTVSSTLYRARKKKRKAR